MFVDSSQTKSSSVSSVNGQNGSVNTVGRSALTSQGVIPDDGVTDAQPALKNLFAAAAALATASNPITLKILPGNYFLGLASANNDITCPSYVTVDATGANFLVPQSLSAAASGNTEYPILTPFKGVDVQNFTWIGGSFTGYAFNQYVSDYTTNTWLPNEGVVAFSFTSTAGNGCKNCQWMNVSGLNFGGSIVRVLGINSGTWGSSNFNYNNTTTWCTNIKIINCNFVNCGAVLWDYGWLWQVLSFQSQYTASQIAMAYAYMNPVCLYGAVGMANGDTHVTFSNTSGAPAGVIPVAPDSTNNYWVSFYVDTAGGGNLPANITAGKRYFVVGSTSTGIQIATSFNGTPITFSSAGLNVKMIYNLFKAYYNLYFPYNTPYTNSGGVSGNGAWMFANVQNGSVVGTTWSSPGDSGGLFACQDCVVDSCQCTDAQMGGLISSGTNRCTWSNDIFISTKGSRCITLENYSQSTTIDHCRFTGYRRGCMIDSAQDVVINGCTFNNNNYSSTGDYSISRIDPTTGTWIVYAPIYLLSSAQGWGNFRFTNNYINSNANNGVQAITVQAAQASGTCYFVDGNTAVGSTPRIGNNGFTVYNTYVGHGVGIAGIAEGQFTASVVGSSTIIIPHGLGFNVQSNNGITFWGDAAPANSATPAWQYITVDNTNAYLTLASPVTAAIAYNWKVQYIFK